MLRIEQKLLHLKAEQEAGRYTLCPRCGRDNITPSYTRALSRLADIPVCQSCGIDEAKLAFMRVPGSLYSWAGLQPDRPASDLETLPAGEVWEHVCKEQTSVIMDLFYRSRGGEPSDEIILCAFESCPGLTRMWTEPFRMDYKARGGTVVIRIRETETGIEMTGATLNGSVKE